MFKNSRKLFFVGDLYTMILIGALTGSMKYNWNELLKKEQIAELNKKG